MDRRVVGVEGMRDADCATLDAEGTRSETGKNVRKDHAAGKATLVSIMGIERAHEQSRILAQQAIRHLDPFDDKAKNLRQMAEFVITRRN